MRPPRLLILLFCFIALPIFLTFLSLLSAHPSQAESLSTGYGTRSSRIRALFSFHTPSSIFPPSAVISLTDDNSTFFLARPAAFGPTLPSKGLSGQLWVGSGFGDDSLRKGGAVAGAEGELGCSDVPGWGEGDKKHTDEQRVKARPHKKMNGNVDDGVTDDKAPSGNNKRSEMDPNTEDESTPADINSAVNEDDGTDDHLHHPLPESNPAEIAKPGQPAEHESINDKTKKPTHADIQSLQESAEIAGNIVLLSRGGCGFLEKVKWVQRRGGIALIIGDDERGGPLITMYARGDTSNVTIPALFTSHTTAHLLSSLIPPEILEDPPTDNPSEQVVPKTANKAGGSKKTKQKGKKEGPTFTATKGTSKPTGTRQPSIVPSDQAADPASNGKAGNRSWLRRFMSFLGLAGETGYPWHFSEDSRRPPSSGNIDWVLLDDWDEETVSKDKSKKPAVQDSEKSNTKETSKTKNSGPQTEGDDFVIGVQDWRDPDLVASDEAKASAKSGSKKAKPGKPVDLKTSDSKDETNGKSKDTDAFKGGSITPGSGEYKNTDTNHPSEPDRAQPKKPTTKDSESQRSGSDKTDPGWLESLKWGNGDQSGLTKPSSNKESSSTGGKSANPASIHHVSDEEGDNEHVGLWVTLTPTSVSTSPFFDTLLVLVVSPLVTLTVVYALLLLRSRIRRRRWRAPKSVVDRLPVRTYHTMSSSSSTSSLQLSTADPTPTSPLLRSTPKAVSPRTRPRSQTASCANSSATPVPEPSPQEKNNAGPARRKRYTGRQVECVVCLEEYVDGQSRVMSLPCGHEFHVECITPWLVTRRRTCPICKGDVVRSMAHAGSQYDQREEGEDTSDDIQVRAAETVNQSPSAAIPIPSRLLDDEDSDIERGADPADSLTGEPQSAPRSSWRNLTASLSALSGETVWRQTPADRSR